MTSSYPLFRATGAPRALGRAHGEQAGEQIRAFLDDLRQRLAEISNGAAPARIAASLIVVTPA